MAEIWKAIPRQVGVMEYRISDTPRILSLSSTNLIWCFLLPYSKWNSAIYVWTSLGCYTWLSKISKFPWHPTFHFSYCIIDQTDSHRQQNTSLSWQPRTESWTLITQSFIFDWTYIFKVYEIYRLDNHIIPIVYIGSISIKISMLSTSWQQIFRCPLKNGYCYPGS